jgi:hypothetical protein
MPKVTLATEDDLAHARQDPSFRQQLVADNLEMLLSELNRLRTSASKTPNADRQMREAANLAVKLAELLQRTDGTHRP